MVASDAVLSAGLQKTHFADRLYLIVTGFGTYEKPEGSWGGAPRDAAYNSFGGRSDRSKTGFFNDRGSGSRGRCVELFHLMIFSAFSF